MAEQREREFLLGIFLMEAWDTAGTLEEGIARLPEGRGALAGAVAPLLIVAHRLKGSAALHGFPGVSELAAATEQRLECLPDASAAERREVQAFVADVIALFKDVFDDITTVGREDAERIVAFKARHPSVFPAAASAPAASPTAPVAPPATAPAAAQAHSDAAYRLVRDVERFFAESADVMPYFGPEAADHLEAMTQSLLVLERAGRDEAELATLLRSTHTLKGAAYTVGCGPVGDVAHQMEDLLVGVREQRIPFGPAAIEACLAGVDALKLVLQSASTPPADLGAALERALEMLRGALGAAAVPAEAEPPAAPPPPARPVAVEPMVAVAAPPRAPLSALGPLPEFLARLEALPRPVLGRAPAAVAGPSIRVSLERLDSLMNLVGELMIARSRLEQHLNQLDRVGELLLFSRSRMGQTVREFEGKHYFPKLPTARTAGEGSGGLTGASLAELFAELEFARYDDVNILARSMAEMSADIAEVQAQHAALLRAVREDVAHIQRLTALLRKEVTRARMVPIGRLFARFLRQVREAARAAGKQVELVLHGEATEVDNTVIEQIADPLLHLIQNAVAHGIEPPAERTAAGKPAQGTISLRAYHQGGFMYVEVEDDGRGMDEALLRRQAVEQGLLAAERAQALTTQEALNLIFVPGFTTASEVTRAAGRGVGMDVVRTNVGRLNGEIEVATEVGVRTRITLKLPLTVAITDALMVRAGTEVLAFPMSAVSVMRHLEPTEIERTGGRETVRVGEQALELLRLDRVLGLTHAGQPGRIPVVILRGGGKPFAVAVDALLNKEEIVVKSLGLFLEGTGPFSGATISGEGRVILLADPTRLLDTAHEAVVPAVPVAGEARAPAAGARHVMLVDDSISVRKFVGQMLEKAGFRVVMAVDGQDALQQLTDLTVQVIVTDLEMPRVNGYQLIEDLRRRPNTRDVPVVVLTTRAGEKHINLARRLGIRHYITKPVDEQAFVRLIDELATPVPGEVAATGAFR
ncbi:MAG TPA: response regulator [Methylomirabilota bacterium]|nr:response regulator [Methylomirabilota bacterium]